ncbi:MAG TPA: alkaline phosphatase family protein, partial [Solirubrobacteraceae bacterium]|nr:alkaline phosphatase family protein [Solirubrobacteraceae bacterium]
ERRSARRARRRDVHPRIERSRVYALVRAWATVIQRDLQVSALLGDLYAGRPVAYTTFLGYDEVAHHSGLERPETLAVLHDVDHHIERLVRAAQNAPRPYRFVILSDHGQSQGTTFRDRYGETLEELVDRCCASATVEGQHGDPSEALAYLGASIGEVAAGDSRTARAVRAAARPRSEEGEVQVGVDMPARGEKAPEVAVLASGCLGLISFPRIPGRLTRERIDALHPGLIEGLASHEGIGFVLVRCAGRGGVAFGAKGTHELATGAVEGEDPLAPFGAHAARHVARTDSFDNCPDIVVNSAYWVDADEVAAFEELVGSHGGLGGTQSRPFLLHPRELGLPDEELVGAEHVHAQLRRWLAELGHSEYAASDGSDGSPS